MSKPKKIGSRVTRLAREEALANPMTWVQIPTTQTDAQDVVNRIMRGDRSMFPVPAFEAKVRYGKPYVRFMHQPAAAPEPVSPAQPEKSAALSAIERTLIQEDAQMALLEEGAQRLAIPEQMPPLAGLALIKDTALANLEGLEVATKSAAMVMRDLAARHEGPANEMLLSSAQQWQHMADALTTFRKD